MATEKPTVPHVEGPPNGSLKSAEGLQDQRNLLQQRLQDGATGGEILLAFSDFMCEVTKNL